MNSYQNNDKRKIDTDRYAELSTVQKKKLKLIRFIAAVVDYSILAISLLLLVLGWYALYDTHKVNELADSEQYVQYKPSFENKIPYEKLRKMNQDVIGWIDVYGTKIDYPVVQTTDNSRYLDEAVTGEYSGAGSIFLDYRNNKDFSDFNSIIYGHHMEESMMFGDVSKFSKKDFFDEHAYGVLHRNGKKSLGIEFFAIIKTEGTDAKILTPALIDEYSKRDIIDYIKEISIQSRPMDITESDSIVLLNTCTFTITNGRYILIGKLTDKVQKDPFPDPNENNVNAKWIKKVIRLPLLMWLILLLLILLLIYCLYEMRRRKQKRKIWEKDECESRENA
ncbi:MAG TPA: class B sortase [Mogibacterium sp.]|nr:class B sortase [Mogibacterium sp.]